MKIFFFDSAINIASCAIIVLALGCTTGNCLLRQQETQAEQSGKKQTVASQVKASIVEANVANKVLVFKYDGSLQCNQGEAIELAEMEKQLKNIKVYRSFKKNDGKMRIQMCGTPTGMCNVYEINSSELEASLKLGFQEWIFD